MCHVTANLQSDNCYHDNYCKKQLFCQSRRHGDEDEKKK